MQGAGRQQQDPSQARPRKSHGALETQRRLKERASQIDAQELADAQSRHDAMAVQSIMRKTLLG